ncbi:MAG: protein kinase domain-containing protein [Myxococcota bacterium]
MSDEHAPRETLPPGTVLAGGKYEVGDLVGEGAMGTVYRGRHTGLSRTVAIKVLHPEIMNRPKVADRFRREARAASRLQHPNSVQVLDFGEEDDLFYIVMEFLEGRSLGDVLYEEGPLSTGRIVHLMTGVCRALARAHDLGIIHRDMKPDNILVFPGVDDDGNPVERVKVCDFGIAKIQQGDVGDSIPTITEVGQVSGTPHYMSPEQCQAMALDSRSDIYSCGVVLYHMATGEVPFDAGSAVNVMVMHISREPEPPSAVNPEISPDLERVIRRAMAKDPDERYPDARALRRALQNLVSARTTADERPPATTGSDPAGEPSPATTGSMSGVSSPRRRGPWLALAAAVTTILVGAVALFALPGGGSAPGERAAGFAEAPPTGPSGPAAAVRDGPPPASLAPATAGPDAEAHEDATPAAPVEVAADGGDAETDGGDASDGGDVPDGGDEAEPVVALAPSADDSTAEPAEPEPAPEPKRRVRPRPEPRSVDSADKPDPAPEEPEPDPPAERPASEEPATVAPEPEEQPEVPSPEPTPDAPGDAEEAEAPPEPPPEPEPEPEDPEPAPAEPTSFEADVSVGGLDVTGSLPANTIRRAVSRFEGAFRDCYREHARAEGRAPGATVRVRVTIDEDGRARDVRTSGGGLAGLDGCIRDVAWKIRTRTRPDTGTVDASFALQFRPESR